MSLADMIDAVGTILGGITGIGNVHKYERWAADDAGFKALFKSDNRILAWTITREATDCVDWPGSTEDRHSLVIHGYMSLDDSANTEKTFQDLIEVIRNTFQPNRFLTVTGVPHAHDSDRIRVRLVDHRMFGGLLVHYAELVLRTGEFVT
jgi:hypothetical protein